MKRVSLVLIAIAVVLSGFVASAQGQRYQSGSQPEVVAAAFAAEVTGTVKNVSDKSGKLVLDTDDGPVNVKLPTEAVQGDDYPLLPRRSVFSPTNVAAASDLRAEFQPGATQVAAGTDVPRWKPADCSFVPVRKVGTVEPGGLVT